MADLFQLTAWLQEAENARHELAMGQAVAEIWRDGRRMTYNKANSGDLNDYIAFLRSEIARQEDEASGTVRRNRRAIGIRYSN